jgi:hypothetical protein
VDEPPPRKEFDFIFEIPASIFEEVAAGLAEGKASVRELGRRLSVQSGVTNG